MSFSGKSPSVNRVRYAPQSTDPVNPLEGDIFYSDGTSRAEGLYVYINGAWQAVVSDTQTIVGLSTQKQRFIPQASDPASPAVGTVFYSNGTPREAGLWVFTSAGWQSLQRLIMVEFTTAGAHVWSPPPGVRSAFIELIGGGGGGGGGAVFGAGGGGSGGRGGVILRTIITDIVGFSASITVGAGGVIGAPGVGGVAANGGPGGATSLTINGRTYTAPGGEGGNGGGATGGAGWSTDLNVNGLIRLGSGKGGDGSGTLAQKAGQPAPNNAITGALGGNGGNFPPGGTPGAGGGGGGGASGSNGGNGGVAPSSGFPTVTSATPGNAPGGGGGGGNGAAAGFIDPLTFGAAGAVGRVRIWY